MKKSTKLLGNSISYSIIGLFPVMVGFFTLPILSRYLSPEEYGILSLVSSFISLVSIAATLQIYSGVARIYFDYDDERRKEYFSTLFYSVSLVATAVFLFFLFAGDSIIAVLYPKSNPGFAPYFFLAMINIFFALPVGITTAFFKVMQKGKELMVLSLVATVTTTAIILYLVVIKKQGAAGNLAGLAVGSFLTYVMHAVYFREAFIFRFSFSMLLENLKFGIPVIPHAVGGYLFMYSDILVLEKFVAVSLIGIYSISDKFATLLKTVVNSFSSSLNPVFMQESKKSVESGIEFVRKTTESWFVILALGYITLCHAGEYLIYIMTPEDFHLAAKILPVLALAYVFRGIYIMPINSFYFMKRTKYLPVATLTSGFMNVGLNFVFIPIIGIWGAAVTTALCFALNWLLLEILSKNTFRIRYSGSSMVFLCVSVIFSNILFYTLPFNEPILRSSAQSVFVFSVVSAVWILDIGGVKSFIRTRLKK